MFVYEVAVHSDSCTEVVEKQNTNELSANNNRQTKKYWQYNQTKMLHWHAQSK